ncbi:hypothetical protein [Parageobacillus toebii]|jgi:hypothetical protein|uniref:hypothetical protein n=1 Tax=Parageobacillus toebii TaxID=153151 RepID=UPI0035B50ACA
MGTIQFTLFTLVCLLIGLYKIWFSMFGKNNDVDESRFLIPDSIIELIVEIGFMFSPTTIKRVLIFLVAFLWSLFFGFLFIESLLEYFN